MLGGGLALGGATASAAEPNPYAGDLFEEVVTALLSHWAALRAPFSRAALLWAAASPAKGSGKGWTVLAVSSTSASSPPSWLP
ncbi:hypothetical protein RHCRD62_70091 [Rhodococcus sp. RD6.2]|nr:hypothetical protein RHCRD62_70091 [Rhodococcus sp. RD6.2]